MKRSLAAFAIAVFTLGGGNLGRADDASNPNTVLDKAIKAMGGAEKLEKIHAVQGKGKGTITIAGNESPLTSQTTLQGLSHYRLDFSGEFGGNKLKGVTIINGDKGWRKLGDETMAIEGDMLKGEKRNLYLQIAGSNPYVPERKRLQAEKDGQ